MNNQSNDSSTPSPAAEHDAETSYLPPTSPVSATPIDLSGANALPYRMERTETLNTVNPSNTNDNIVVQTDSRILRQRSSSQDLAVSPVPSNDAAEEKPSTIKKGGKGKSKSGIIKESFVSNAACINPSSEVNARLDTQVEVRVYPCNNSNNDRKKKFTQFMVKPEVISKSHRTLSFFLVSDHSHILSSCFPCFSVGRDHSRN